MCLRDCPVGFQGRIKIVEGPLGLKRRLLEMGFVPGRLFKVIRNAPLRDPIEVEIMGYHLAIRKDEATYVKVERG